jgi:hypothetical protein
MSYEASTRSGGPAGSCLGETAIIQMMAGLETEFNGADGVSFLELCKMDYDEDFWNCWWVQDERKASRFIRRSNLAEQLGYLQMAKEARLNCGANAQDDRVIKDEVEKCAAFELRMSDDLSKDVRLEVGWRRLSIWDMIIRRSEEAKRALCDKEEDLHRHKLASIRLEQADAACLVLLEEEDRIAEADSKPLEASKANEGSQDLQIAQGKGNMEGNLKITREGMDDQESTAGSVFLIQFKILAAMLAIQDGQRATRYIQDALLWIYDPGGQLYSV